MKRNTVLTGTIFLTIMGLITRIIGFFYKIYLSNTLGAEKLGLYQLIFPVYSVCFTIYAIGIQTAISQMVAGEIGKMGTNYKIRIRKILSTGLATSLALALTLTFLLHNHADFIAETILHEADSAASLRILSYVFPFCGVTACINGFYYGLKKTGIPAFTQLIEQTTRVLCVFIMATYIGDGNMKITCELAVLGLVIGEIASNFFNLFSLRFTKTGLFDPPSAGEANVEKIKRRNLLRTLGKISAPLSLTRLITSLLLSLEAILIPSMLKRYGLSGSEALSVYGVITGMSIPFILFPSTITNSLAVLLLPTVSEAQSVGNQDKIRKTTQITIKYSLIIGVFSTGIFIIFGNSLGVTFFKERSAGTFLVILSWLCPFLYLSTTLNSVINGLGKTHLTFFNTIIGLSIRILFIVFLIPYKGIVGYLIGLLFSQLSIALLDYMAVKQSTPVHIDSIHWIVIPSACMFLFGYITKYSFDYLDSRSVVSSVWLLLFGCLILCFLYFISLYLLKIIGNKDWRS